MVDSKKSGQRKNIPSLLMSSSNFVSNQAPRALNVDLPMNRPNVAVAAKPSSGRNDFLVALLVIGGIVALWIIWQMWDKQARKRKNAMSLPPALNDGSNAGFANPLYRGNNPCNSCEKPPSLWPAGTPVTMTPPPENAKVVAPPSVGASSSNDNFYRASFLDVE